MVFFKKIHLLFFIVFYSLLYAKIPDTLAVVPFKVIGEIENPAIYEYGLPDGISFQLKKYNNLVIVNRTRLADIIHEYKLSQTGLMDEKSIIKVGQMVLANGIITGVVYVTNQQIKCDVQLMDVHSGELIIRLTEESQLQGLDIFSFQNRIAKRFASRLKWQLRSEGQLSFQEPDSMAYAHFIKALSYLYQGDKEMAKKEGAWALQIDPAYSPAVSFEKELDDAFEEMDKVLKEMDQ